MGKVAANIVLMFLAKMSHRDTRQVDNKSIICQAAVLRRSPLLICSNTFMEVNTATANVNFHFQFDVFKRINRRITMTKVITARLKYHLNFMPYCS